MQWRRRGWAKWAAAQGLASLTPALVCIGIAFTPYTVAVVCLRHVLLSEIDNNEEGIKKVFYKSPWTVNDSEISIVDGRLCTVQSHMTPSLNVCE
jgi:hypothetical protein